MSVDDRQTAKVDLSPPCADPSHARCKSPSFAICRSNALSVGAGGSRDIYESKGSGTSGVVGARGAHVLFCVGRRARGALDFVMRSHGRGHCFSVAVGDNVGFGAAPVIAYFCPPISRMVLHSLSDAGKI